MDNLTPTLNDMQLRQNIDALVAQKAPREVVQSYIDNYSKSADGNYVLKSATPPKSVTPQTPSFGSKVADEQIAGAKKTAEGFQQGVEATGKNDIGGMFGGAAKTSAGAVETFMAPVNAATKLVVEKLQPTFQKLADASGYHPIEEFKQSSLGKEMEKLAQEHPDATDFIKNTATIIAAMTGVKGGLSALEDVGGLKSLSTVGSNLVEDASALASKGKEAIGNVKNVVTNKASNILSGMKPEAEILATPPDKVRYLSPKERAIYNANELKTSSDKFSAEQNKLNQAHQENVRQATDTFKNDKNATAEDFKAQQEKLNQAHQENVDALKQKAQSEQNSISQRHTDAEAKINADLEAKTSASLKNIQDLKTEVDKTSVADANSLKPKAIQVFKENSTEFQKRFEKDFTPEKQKIPLKQSDIIAKLDSEFSGTDENLNPKYKLGLDPEGKDITAKDFYDKVRSMNVSSAGSKGTSTFTQNDMVVNRTRGVLSDTLNDKGIDLSESNAFWKEWKPLQREINSKVQPFQPYKSGTMANVLKSSASLTGDAKNAKWIADFESQLGEKLPTGTRTAMEKLSSEQKNLIADTTKAAEEKANLATQTKQALEDSKNSTTKSIRKLEDAKTQAERKLEDAKKQYTDTSNKAQTEKLRELKDQKAQADSALKEAKDKENTQINSRQIETERTAELTKKRIAFTIAKWVAGGVITIESAKKLLTGSF